MQVKKVAHFEGHRASVYALEQGAAPNIIYTAGADHLILEWNLHDHGKSRVLMNMPERIFALKLLRKQNILLAGNYTGGIHVIDLNKGEEVMFLQHHQQIIFEIELLPHKEAFIALSADGVFSVWSTNDFSLLEAKSLGHFKLRSIDFHPHREEMVIGCEDGFIRVIDLTDFREINKLDGHLKDFSVNALKYLKDGRQLLSGSRDANLVLWETENDYVFRKGFQFHKYAIYGIALSPDGQYLASASRDKSVKIWDAATLDLLYTIAQPEEEGHTKSVNKIMWSDYESLLISTGDDRSVKAWEIIG